MDFADLVDFLGEDPYTRSILIYMENVGEGTTEPVADPTTDFSL